MLLRLILHGLQALGDAVRVTLTLQVRALSVTRVRARVGGSEGCGSVSMHYYGFCIYFSVTIWDCMDIVDYLDCAGHIMLVMFVVVAFCSLDD